MINLQNEYAKLIQQELDKNTQGLRFEVSLNNLKTDSELQRLLQIPNTYAKEIKRYIPVVIESFDGDFAELENMSAAEVFANMTLLIPTDEFDVNNQVVEETFVLVSQALNEMSKRTRAKVFQLGEKCFILPKNNTSIIDLDSLFGVNLEFEIEFTNKEDNTLFEVFGNKFISKLGNDVLFDNTTIISDYEINKKYTFKLFREDPAQDYFITIDDGDPIDLSYTNTDLTSQIKLLSQFEKIYSVVVTNHQNEIVYEETDFTILSNPGGIPWGSEGTITLNFSLPRRLSNQMTLGEYNYQEFEINTSGAYNDRAFVGQHIEYYLNDVRIFPVSRDEGYIGEPDNARFLGSNKGNRTVIEQTAIGKEYALYYIPEPKIVDLIEQITDQEPNANALYELRIVYPLFEREYTTVLSQGGLSIVNSTPLGISFALEIADDIIIPEPTPVPKLLPPIIDSTSSTFQSITAEFINPNNVSVTPVAEYEIKGSNNIISQETLFIIGPGLANEVVFFNFPSVAPVEPSTEYTLYIKFTDAEGFEDSEFVSVDITTDPEPTPTPTPSPTPTPPPPPLLFQQNGDFGKIETNGGLSNELNVINGGTARIERTEEFGDEGVIEVSINGGSFTVVEDNDTFNLNENQTLQFKATAAEGEFDWELLLLIKDNQTNNLVGTLTVDIFIDE